MILALAIALVVWLCWWMLVVSVQALLAAAALVLWLCALAYVLAARGVAALVRVVRR